LIVHLNFPRIFSSRPFFLSFFKKYLSTTFSTKTARKKNQTRRAFFFHLKPGKMNVLARKFIWAAVLGCVFVMALLLKVSFIHGDIDFNKNVDIKSTVPLHRQSHYTYYTSRDEWDRYVIAALGSGITNGLRSPRRRLLNKSSVSILGLGSGTGAALDTIARISDQNVSFVGIDRAPRAVQTAKQYFSSHHPHIKAEFLVGSMPRDLMKLRSGATARFDIILAIGVFCYLRNLKVVLETLAMVLPLLSPTGIIVASMMPDSLFSKWSCRIMVPQRLWIDFCNAHGCTVSFARNHERSTGRYTALVNFTRRSRW
jgi:SAM-dependent methyltransferase